MADPVEPPDEFLDFAKDAFEHRGCRAAAEQVLGGDVTTEVLKYGAGEWRCDHGVRYWLVPVEAGG
jgi:hypothetical protein